MQGKSGRVSIILSIIFVVIAAITLPGFFRYFYQAGAGHYILETVSSENLPWDTMSDAAREPYKTRAKAEGIKCAVLMTLGQHLPFYLLILITIGLLTSSISYRFRIFLRFAFFAVWFFGMLFLSLGTGYWGQGPQFPESIGASFIIYFIAIILFGIILSIGKLIQKFIKKDVTSRTHINE